LLDDRGHVVEDEVLHGKNGSFGVAQVHLQQLSNSFLDALALGRQGLSQKPPSQLRELPGQWHLSEAMRVSLSRKAGMRRECGGWHRWSTLGKGGEKLGQGQDDTQRGSGLGQGSKGLEDGLHLLVRIILVASARRLAASGGGHHVQEILGATTFKRSTRSKPVVAKSILNRR